MQKVSNLSIFVMYTMYFLAALFGYLTFYGKSSYSWNFLFVIRMKGQMPKLNLKSYCLIKNKEAR